MAKEHPATKKCKYCKTEIDYEAKVCPQCRKKQPAQGFAKVLGGILLAVGFIIVLSALFGGDNGDSTPTSTTKEEEVIEYTSVSVQDMMTLLQDNALKAKEEYNGKYLEITGVMNVVDSNGKYIGVYSSSWDIIGVQCYLKNEEQRSYVSNQSTGYEITVRVKVKDVGEILGYQADVIEFVD